MKALTKKSQNKLFLGNPICEKKEEKQKLIILIQVPVEVERNGLPANSFGFTTVTTKPFGEGLIPVDHI